MSRCTCVRGADILCRYCESRMEAAIEAREGRPRGYSRRDRDDRADGAAADMVFGRESR